MHPYGHNRFASLSCKYGCCGTVPGVGCLKWRKARKAEDRAARKRARRDGKREATCED